MAKHRLWSETVPEWTIPAHGWMRPTRSGRTWVTGPQRGGRRRRGKVRRLLGPALVLASLLLSLNFGDYR
jgi:hypothetical protein